MTQRDSRNFVSTQWLAEHLHAPDVAIIDGSWHLPTSGRDGRHDYLEAHIPGAVFFDIDEISDKSSGLPHMMPSALDFSAHMKRLGLGDGLRFVIYDQAGLFSAPRVWWMLRSFGVTDVVILEGGLPRWLAEGRAVESGVHQRKPRQFTARLDHGAIASMTGVQAWLDNGHAQIVDARPAARFSGEVAEPRPGVASGHMPGSFNVPFSAVVSDGQLKPASAIEAAFAEAGVDVARPIVTSCGSGVSAAILAVALEEIGHPVKALYDGSWAEWGSSAGQPIATGPGRK